MKGGIGAGGGRVRDEMGRDMGEELGGEVHVNRGVRCMKHTM